MLIGARAGLDINNAVRVVLSSFGLGLRDCFKTKFLVIILIDLFAGIGDNW